MSLCSWISSVRQLCAILTIFKPRRHWHGHPTAHARSHGSKVWLHACPKPTPGPSRVFGLVTS